MVNHVLKPEAGHLGLTGNDVVVRLTDAEVATITSSANAKFDAVAREMSKRIEEIAKTVSDAE